MDEMEFAVDHVDWIGVLSDHQRLVGLRTHSRFERQPPLTSDVAASSFESSLRAMRARYLIRREIKQANLLELHLN